jgi:hypothetical protein
VVFRAVYEQSFASLQVPCRRHRRRLLCSGAPSKQASFSACVPLHWPRQSWKRQETGKLITFPINPQSSSAVNLVGCNRSNFAFSLAVYRPSIEPPFPCPPVAHLPSRCPHLWRYIWLLSCPSSLISDLFIEFWPASIPSCWLPFRSAVSCKVMYLVLTPMATPVLIPQRNDMHDTPDFKTPKLSYHQSPFSFAEVPACPLPHSGFSTLTFRPSGSAAKHHPVTLRAPALHKPTRPKP